MRAAARDLRAKGAALVLVKGGHLAGANGRAAVDVACDGDGLEELESEVVRCETSHGITLSAGRVSKVSDMQCDGISLVGRKVMRCEGAAAITAARRVPARIRISASVGSAPLHACRAIAGCRRPGHPARSHILPLQRPVP